jgi:predicted RNA binding protein YcfA (HicA-like mRNA interferase family)
VTPKLSSISGQEVVKALQKIGFTHIRTKGDHSFLFNEKNGKTVTIPLKKRLSKGVVGSIVRMSGISREELEELIS